MTTTKQSGHGKRSVQRVANENRLYVTRPSRDATSIKVTPPEVYVKRDDAFPGGYRFIVRSPREQRATGDDTADFQSLADVIASFALAMQRAMEACDELEAE